MRFKAYYSHDSLPGLYDITTGKFHVRTEYTDIEIASLARWLNEREAGYPAA